MNIAVPVNFFHLDMAKDGWALVDGCSSLRIGLVFSPMLGRTGARNWKNQTTHF